MVLRFVIPVFSAQTDRGVHFILFYFKLLINSGLIKVLKNVSIDIYIVDSFNRLILYMLAFMIQLEQKAL